ncbi:MAG TPA: DoxX family protein [Mycobacterium sp.]|nr:DoxX family protein [Mycobacterium sp.]
MATDWDTRLSGHTPAALSLFRVVFGLLYCVHGTSKLFDWPVVMDVPSASWPYWWAGLIEFVAGLLIMTGLFTRAAAFVAAGQMAIAYFWEHQRYALWPIDPAQGGHGGGEPSVLYCFAFLLLVFTGGGAYALDRLRRRGP